MKINVALCLMNKVPLHKDGWGSGGIAPPYLTSHWMEVSGQLHVPAALSPGKEPPVPIG
jgi:hypothetical protein